VGTCTESVDIYAFEKLGIVSPEGQTATIVSSNPYTRVLGIWQSRNIYLYGLVLQRGLVGLQAGGGPQIVVEGLVAEHNTQHGVQLGQAAALEIRSAEFRNNGGSGILVSNNSQAVNWGGSPWGVPDAPLRVSNNAGPGVSVNNASFYTSGVAIVEDNGGPGFDVKGGIASLVGVFAGANIIGGNQGGASVWQTGVISCVGQNVIQDNGPFGIRAVLGGYAEFWAWGAPYMTTVEGHTDLGVEVRKRGRG
jgi:hypothetical protein